MKLINSACVFNLIHGINKPFVIECNKLKKEDAEQLSHLINEVDLKNFASKNTLTKWSSDAKNYNIILYEIGKHSTLHFSDTDDNIL